MNEVVNVTGTGLGIIFIAILAAAPAALLVWRISTWLFCTDDDLVEEERGFTIKEQELWDIGTEYLDSEQGRKDWPRPEAVELSHYLHSINYRNMDAPNLAADILQHLRLQKEKTTP